MSAATIAQPTFAQGGVDGIFLVARHVHVDEPKGAGCRPVHILAGQVPLHVLAAVELN
jgi:hypothetical protein